jgi:hypothetical protein
LVRRVVFHGEAPTAAGAALGLTSGEVSQTFSQRRVAAALHEAVALAIRAEAPINIQVLRRIRDSERAPAGVRADIAIKLLRLAGHVEPSSADVQPEKALSEMSAEELRAWRERNQQEIDRLEGELALRAKTVSDPAGAPAEPIAGPNALTYLD